MIKTNIYLYLDDVRLPKDERWEVVTNYDEFVAHVELNGLENYECISLDHDLGEEAMAEYYRNVTTNNRIDYENISEKTGYDCAKWIINKSINDKKPLPKIYCHSANPVGANNIMNYVNSYYKSVGIKNNCEMVKIDHGYRELTVEEKFRRLAIKHKDLK
jgi:hypothetical protein